MNFTEDQLRAQGYVIVDGRAVKRPKGVMPSAGTNDSSKRPEQSLWADGGVTHPPKSTSKYRNKRCEYNGEWFDSLAERDWVITLQAREAAGEISNLRRQVKYPLYAPVMVNGHVNGVTQVSEYRADAVYVERGQTIIADRKSKPTRTKEFRLKAQWLNAQDGISITVVL